MKKFFLFVYALSFLFIALGSVSCSSGNEDFFVDEIPNDSINQQSQSDQVESVEANVVIDSLVGKWLLVKDGGKDVSYRKNVLTFIPDGMVVRSIADGSESEDEEQKSSFVLEGDWTFLEETVLAGHIQFSLYGDDRPDRFMCSFVDGQMVLLPDMGYRYFRDPTMKFERVKQ